MTVSDPTVQRLPQFHPEQGRICVPDKAADLGIPPAVEQIRSGAACPVKNLVAADFP
jgi:hypothetical protein